MYGVLVIYIKEAIAKKFSNSLLFHTDYVLYFLFLNFLLSVSVNIPPKIHATLSLKSP